ncbi:hypothetical protein MS3_00003155 [Schistosoma haematobium]|uniref:Uncharacterized protein n=1 Tax=Schistosoma haematobium TaxID=6185 RepID=A0A094ZXL1_SCHHA|nr:hypothetical protein MS3_00003155 [Schistosoma haematobium]KAH9590496.1 hypothetical protein MS3_00003155 [Schistosoma haematobium]
MITQKNLERDPVTTLIVNKIARISLAFYYKLINYIPCKKSTSDVQQSQNKTTTNQTEWKCNDKNSISLRNNSLLLILWSPGKSPVTPTTFADHPPKNMTSSNICIQKHKSLNGKDYRTSRFTMIINT